MAMDDGQIAWFSPDPRAIIPLDDFHVPHGLKRALKRDTFEIRINTAFDAVIRGCAERDGTWISEEIIASYSNLHRLGDAHSVEAWADGRLAGGLYGVAIGGAFFGESMFHEVTDASKVAHSSSSGCGETDSRCSIPMAHAALGLWSSDSALLRDCCGRRGLNGLSRVIT